VLLLTVIALLTGGGLLGWWMLGAEPAAWGDAAEEVDALPDSAAVAAELEEAVQRAVTAPMGPGERRVLVVPIEAANAWLEERLPLWLAAQGHALPEQVGAMRFVSREGVVTGMVLLEHEGHRQLVSADATARMNADGTMTAELLGVRLGRVPIPLGLVVDRLEAMGGGQGGRAGVGTTAGAFLRAGEQGLRFDPAGPLPNDSRVLRVTGIEIEAGRVLVEVTHE